MNRRAEFRPTRIGRGASIGANATVVCGHSIGAHAFVGAGAVVARDVPAFALVVGVPARQIGGVRRAGERLGAIDEASFILGPQVAAFEQELASFCGARHAISCANGTDAIALCLMALGLRPGDAVLLPSFTFASTAEVVASLGASPVFVDIEEATYTLDPDGLEGGLAAAGAAGLRARAVIAVDLFGQPAEYASIETFCETNGLALICDSAQGFGCNYRGRPAGTIGSFTTTSFFSRLNATITLTKPIEVLGIPAGVHDVQRLLYYNFVKCFWNEAFDYETNNMVNFDWYHPHDAWQHTHAEVEGWIEELGAVEYRFNDANPNGISVLVTRPAN